MMMKGLSCAVLLMLAIQLPAHADWAFPGFTSSEPSPAAKDRAFECEVQQRLDEQAERLQGVDAVVTRFDNTIVITGQARTAAERARIEKLVLDVAGIMREQPGGAAVVPANTRNCEGRTVAANSKRKSILDASGDCSSLRADNELPVVAKGQVYNHIGVASPDPVAQLARAELLVAQARLALLESDVINAMDRSLIRLVAQGREIYVLGNMDIARQSEIRAVLMKLPRIAAVRFYVD
jgi:hypothetical protein